MRTSFWAVALAAALSGGAPAARADVWDVGTDNDNSSTSDNEMVHGLSQVHDVAAQQGGTVEDVDWYPLRSASNHSYEILLDGLTGGVGNTSGLPRLEVLAADASTVIHSAQPVSSLEIARRITFIAGIEVVESELSYYVRVRNPACALSCVNTDQYHISLRDTTVFVPRFNNSATQVSVLILQNSTSADVFAEVVAHDATGAIIGLFNVSLTPNQVTTVNLSTVNSSELAGKSGALKIVNDAPYGALAGKVVALEPATGFTFDTPLVYKPR
jgi:hypothetical protein